MSSSEGKRPQRRPSTLDLAAQDLMMAAQGSPSRPGSIVEQSQRVTNKDQTGTSKNRELPTQYNNSRSDDSKYPQDRDILGRRLSAVRLGLPEEFYRTKSPTPAKPPSRRQTPAAMSRSQTPVGQTAQSSASVRRWLDESSAEQKPLSEEIGLCTYEIQAKRLTMARLWAAKTLIEQAYEHNDLDPKVEESKRPLYRYGNQVENIMFQLTDVVQHLGNDKLVRDYEKAYTIPKESKYYGKHFVKVVPADAMKMLSAAQSVADQIVSEIQ